MSPEEKPAQRIFLQYSLLIVLLAAFNFYSYSRRGAKLFLAVGIVCIAALIGWALFYLFYVRRKDQ